MKICFVSTLYPPNIVGGAERAAAKLAEALVRAGHDVIAITLHDNPETKIETINGVKVYYLPMDNLYWPFKGNAKPAVWKRFFWHLIDMWNVKAATRVAAILDAEKPDVMNSNNLAGFSVAVWMEAKKRGIKIIHTLHDYSLLCPRSTLYKHGKSCETRCGTCVAMSLPKYFASRYVDHTVGVSAYVADKHRQYGYFPDAKHSVIFNIGEPSKKTEQTVSAHNQEFVFGFIGRVEEEKGIEVLLQSVALLPDHGWRLRIAGRGIERYVDELKKKYPFPNIEWLGYVKADDFYKSINLLVVPSVWHEPLPCVIAEAGAYDIPQIISKMGGMPEFLEMGIRGVAIPAGDVHRLANEMKEAMNGRGAMLINAVQNPKWQSELSENTVVKQYLAC